MADDLPEYVAFSLEFGCANEPCIRAPEFHHPRHQPTWAPWNRQPKDLHGKAGKAQRCSDWYGFGLCPHCHSELHDGRGQFADMSKNDRRAWQDKATEKMHERWTERYPDRFPSVVVPRAKTSKLRARGSRSGNGWTVPLVIDLLKREASHRPAGIRDALLEIVNLVQRNVR